MNKKISFLQGVIIGEWLPIDTLKLQQSSPLSGSDLEVTTVWSKGGRGEDGWESNSSLVSPNKQLCALSSRPSQKGAGKVQETGGDCIEAKMEKKKNPWV